MTLQTSVEWMTDALCAEVDPDAMFPPKGSTSAIATDLCTRCDVVEQCLRFALANNYRVGVFGGMSARQRKPLHRAYEKETA